MVQAGNEYAEAYAAAVVQADVTGALFCHAYDDPDMVAGNGTVGLELGEQLPDGFDTVLVAVGGGGLIAGVTAALRPACPGGRGRAGHLPRPCTRRWPRANRSTFRCPVWPPTRSARGGPAGSRSK